MTYSRCSNMGNCGGSRGYSSGGIDRAVNKIYVNIQNLNVNNGNWNEGIQHSIAAQGGVGNVSVYNSIENLVNVNNHTTNYVVNLDSPPREFIPPYICAGEVGYDAKKQTYLLPAPSNTYDAGTQEYQSMITTGMLKPNRPLTQFIEHAEDIQDIVLETFEKLTGRGLPDNIVIRVCSEEEMKKAHKLHGGQWVSGILGFAINRHPYPSLVFVRNNNLDSLMLTVGHEIGHVLSERLDNPIDEEAKAFAFELAWAKTIIENDIGSLGASFNVDFMPAENGVHDKAFNFVQKMVRKGQKAIDVFRTLIARKISVLHTTKSI